MLDENTDETIIKQQSVEKRNLMKKYDISLDKLSFEYIEKCTSIKELERIVKILRSGEEGYYEELQEYAEKHLRALAPSSRVLRKEEQILMKDSLMPDDRDELDNEMKEWLDEVVKKDEELCDWNKNHTSDSTEYIPPVRRGVKKENNLTKTHQVNNKKLKRPAMSDYATWDKYDADSELVKMDAEEERKKEEEEIMEKKKEAEIQSELRIKERGRLNDIIRMAQTLPDAEKSCLAAREKDRGNEYYRTSNYDDSVVYYTASITICPNAVAYNNRAASFLKQGKYDLALKDVNRCLELDPENTKGLYRRGLCLQHKNRFDEALEDMQTVLRKEPHNVLVQHVAKELRQQCKSVPRSVRMLVEEHKELKVVELAETEAKRIKDASEVNEWGLARNVCSCDGRPRFLTKRNDAIADHLIYKPDDDGRKKKKSVSDEFLKIEPPVVDSSNMNVFGPLIVPVGNNVSEEDAVETSRIAFKKDVNNETDSIPKKIKIIETVKLSNPSNGFYDDCVKVKDMRGKQRQVNGQKESNVAEQIDTMKIEEFPSTVDKKQDITEGNVKIEAKERCKENEKKKDGNKKQQTNTGQSRGAADMSNSRCDCVHRQRKQTISVATKYTTQKVTSSKNFNKCDKHNDSSNEYVNGLENNCISNNNNNSNNNNINNNNNCNDNNSNYDIINDCNSKSDDTAKEIQITPFKFFQTWSSVKDSSSSQKEYADILRRISPLKLQSVLGNKLDATMLIAMMKSLANEFDVANGEGGIVKQYLVAISNVDRFQIVVEFLSNDVKQMICGLIEKVGGDDVLSLKKSYLIA